MKYAIFSVTIFMTNALAQVGEVVVLPGFGIDRTEVTIGQFERYVRSTGITTRAEKEGGGFEFGAGWERRPGWSWRKPDGQATTPDMPAVHVDFAEAQAYCRWAGGVVYPQGRSGKRQGLPSCGSRPRCLGKKAELILGLPATARKVPTRVTLIHGRVLRPQVPQNKASTVCMTWEPMCGSGSAAARTTKGASDARSGALGGMARSI